MPRAAWRVWREPEPARADGLRREAYPRCDGPEAEQLLARRHLSDNRLGDLSHTESSVHSRPSGRYVIVVTIDLFEGVSEMSVEYWVGWGAPLAR